MMNFCALLLNIYMDFLHETVLLTITQVHVAPT